MILNFAIAHGSLMLNLLVEEKKGYHERREAVKLAKETAWYPPKGLNIQRFETT